MKFFAACVPWLLGATFAVAQITPLSSVTQQTKLPGNSVENRFVLEFASSSNLPPRDFEERTPHELVYASLKKRSVSFQVDKEYNSNGLFVGAAITLKNADDAKAVASTPGVVAIRPVKALQLIQPVSVQVISDAGVAAQIDTESTHIMTGVDKVHAAGITGKGVKIGIIDTGIDYTHPLLGSGFGPGYKVIGGYDFVGNAYTGSNTPVPGPDPLDQCNGHGTHVAGIIGANPGNEFNISGVAYDAQLSAYRVFGCSGFVTDDIIIEALLRGASDGNDILTLSLGGADGWTESSSEVVASRIAASGKIVTIAAGNDGASGSWYTSSPGNGINVISVASVENTVVPLQQAFVGGVQHNSIAYYALFPLPVQGSLPIYATSNDTTVTADACSPLPDTTPDLSKYVVIIRRGTCTFVTKLANAAAKGAKVALIYDNGSGFNAISVGNYTAALIQAADGEFLVQQFVAGSAVTLSFPQTGGSLNFPSPNGGLVSSFSTYGPTNDFYFKPAVAAPGGNILSTLPVPLGSFGIESGTSMATPFVAGSSALLLQAKGKNPLTATLARTFFETTAKSIPSGQNATDLQQTLTQQGSGLIQVYNAINYKTIVAPGELILNDTAHFHGSQFITVINTGSSVQTYKVSHVPVGTATTIGRFSTWPNLGPVPLTTQYATVTFSQSSFSLVPYQSIIIHVQVTPPYGVDATKFPVYSGFVQIDGGIDESLHVPYIGLAASLQDKQVLDTTSYYFGIQLPGLLDTNFNPQTGPANYTLTNGDAPTLLFRLVFGTPILRADLVKSDVNIALTLSRRANNPDVYSFPQNAQNNVTSVPTVGSIFEFDYLTRNNEDPQSNGYSAFTLAPTFANGTTIPIGSYRLLLRALRVTGNLKDQSQYESWLSPIINIVP
ncbi:pyrolysin [Amanita muscaria]